MVETITISRKTYERLKREAALHRALLAKAGEINPDSLLTADDRVAIRAADDDARKGRLVSLDEWDRARSPTHAQR